jgi:pimeloyl-ACP methyl ester carboxylesterase
MTRKLRRLAARPSASIPVALIAVFVACGVLFAVAAAPVGASVRAQRAGAKAAAAARGHFARRVAIGGGRRLYLECRGRGSPTVVFESGSGNAADIWSSRKPGSRRPRVLPAVARFTRVCAYDRPGTSLQSGRPSRSDRVPLPRSARAVVADLHALLAAARVPCPYVLVGHSLGGLLARLYAGTYPRQVAGFVSVDAAHEIYYEALQALLTPEQLAPYRTPGLEIDPSATAAEMRRARVERPLRPMPMYVLEHSRDRGRFPNPLDYPPGYPVEALERAFQASQDDLATLLPYAQHVIAARSEHYIQLDQPRLVIRAVRRVVEALRPVAVRCRGGGSFCRARVSLARGASNKRVVIRLSDADLRLVSVRANRRFLRGAYGLAGQRLRRGGSEYVFRLNAAQTIPRGSYLTFTFRAIGGR